MRRLIKPRHRTPPEGNAAVHDSKPGLAVLDPDLVVIDGGEEEADVEGYGGRIGEGGIRRDADVLYADVLEVELGLFGLDGEYYD